MTKLPQISEGDGVAQRGKNQRRSYDFQEISGGRDSEGV